MFDYLDKLRAKPIHVRKRIAVASTALLFLVVFGVWWNNITAEENTAPAFRAVPALSPWRVVADTFGHMKGETLASFRNATNQLPYVAQGNGTSTSSVSEEAVELDKKIDAMVNDDMLQ